MLAAYAELDKDRKKELKEIISLFANVIADDIPFFKPMVLLKNNLRIMG